MSLDTLETTIKKALSETELCCVFNFQGGEPMLTGLDFYNHAIDFQKKYNINKVKIINTIQSNGTLVTEEWADFFAKNNFLVGLSVDGYRDIHNFMRVDNKNGETFTSCMNAVSIFNKHRVEYNILTVITNQLAKHPDKVYRFYKKNNFRFIQFIPCLDGLYEEPGQNFYSLKSDTYGRFLIRIFDLWYEDYINNNYFSIRSFNDYVNILMGNRPESCAMQGFCESYPVIEADGSVYPCDFYVIDEYELGNIKNSSFQDMLSSDVSKKFTSLSKQPASECPECEYMYICKGGCRRDRESGTPEALTLNRYCEAYKMFFKHALPYLQSIAQKELYQLTINNE